uniref:Integrase, catalytic region, zinc finger, CCHC-type, peptidase aspartic, catalytic n=1 Tax=Tanacetum cinerariifolium TaxID=118510 RepID=A0A6L2JEZ1_TANCI|nr:hypothetical protein [Tanacetum cinerariifolium]
MDLIIPLGQNNTLAEYMILSDANNCPPMLDKDLVSKDLWERVQLLMQGTSLTKQERECKQYDAFDKFTHIKGLPPEWSKFVTDVKLVKDLHTTNFDQLHAYLEQHELHANKVRLLCERNLGLAIPVFSSGDVLITCLNKAMAFLTAVTSSRFPLTNNQLRTSSNPRNQSTIQDGETMQVDRQGLLNATPVKTEDLDTYDSDCDDISNAKVILMATIFNYGSDVISEKAQQIKPTLYDGIFISNKHVAMPVIDDEETLILEEVSRSKMSEKEKDPEAIKQKISNKPIDYVKMNKLYEDFGKRFVSQQELSPEKLSEVQIVFDQMDAVVQQFLVDKQCLEIAKKELLLEIDRLLQQIMSQDILLTIMNYMSLIGEYVNMERKRNESCDKCFNLDAELLKSQNTYNDILKRYSQLEKHCIFLESLIQLNQEIFQKDESFDNQNDLKIPKYFQNNDLKAQLQDKDTIICKLKEIIKSIREKSKEENVNYDYCEIQTKNMEMENSVAKLLLENKRLCKEINHVKQVFKEQFNSIKKTRVCTKEQSDSLIDKLNLKSAENKDLKAQIQEKSQLNANSELIYATCKKSMFNGVHDMRLFDFVKNVNSRAKSATKHNKQNIWKPTGHVFTEVGFKWKPTGKTFTIVGNSCPLTRITSDNVVPPKKTTSHLAKTQKPELKVYSRKPKNVKTVGSSKKAKIVESKNANHSEPNHTWGFNATDIPSSFSLIMTGYPDCSLVSGLRMFETYDREPLSAHELC